MSTAETKALIEEAVRNFQQEVPALRQLKLVLELELRGRGDIQLFRVEVPGPKVTFASGTVKASGPAEILKLIQNVVEKQEERSRTRKLRTK